MKLARIGHCVPEPLCASRKPIKGVVTEFPFCQSLTVDADRSQKRQLLQPAKIKQPIQMAMSAVHLMPSAGPFDPASCRQVTIGCASLPDRCFL